MATLFSRIIAGELPGKFVWKDDAIVAFLTIHPIRPGHTLVVPRAEVDHWLDLEPAVHRRLMDVSRSIGIAIQRAFEPTKVGMMIAGLEVPHVHVHLIPIDKLEDLNPANQDPNPDPAELDRAADTIRSALRALGHREVTDR